MNLQIIDNEILTHSDTTIIAQAANNVKYRLRLLSSCYWFGTQGGQGHARRQAALYIAGMDNVLGIAWHREP